MTDVTLLPCPMCGGTDIRIAHLSASPNQSVWCHSCQLRTKWCYRDDAIAAWNTRVTDPRIAALEAQLAEARDCIVLFNRMIVSAECTWKEQHPDSEFYPDVPDLIVWLKEQVDTLAARRCETCKYGRRISDIAYECKRTHANLVMWAHDGCSRWEQSKKKRGAADG